MRRSYKERVIGYLKVLRPPLMILGLIAPLSLYLWSHKTIDFRGILVITAIFTGNLGYTLLNEYIDFQRGTDIVNKPEKPLPSKLVDPEKVLAMSSILIATSLCTTIILTIYYGLFYLVGLLGLAFSHVYNVLRKDLLGNICMSGAYGIAALISLYPKHPLFSLAFTLLVFAFNLAVQYQDLEAERTAGVVTAPQQLERIGTYLLGVILSSWSGYLFCQLAIKTYYLPLIAFIISASLSLASAFSIPFVSPESKVQEILNRYLGRLFLFIGFVWMIAVEVLG